MTKNARNVVTPRMIGRSFWFTASIDNLPIPGRLNTDSVRIAPPSSAPKSRPKTVTIGVSTERIACLAMTTRSCRPLARAVRM